MNVRATNSNPEQPAPAIRLPADRDSWIALNRWLDQIGTSSVTAWRWRQRGWLKVVNVGGRLFLRPEDRAEFEQRAAAGEFAKRPDGAAGVSSRVRAKKEKQKGGAE
jgi:hypothetical protein